MGEGVHTSGRMHLSTRMCTPSNDKTHLPMATQIAPQKFKNRARQISWREWKPPKLCTSNNPRRKRARTSNAYEPAIINQSTQHKPAVPTGYDPLSGRFFGEENAISHSCYLPFPVSSAAMLCTHSVPSRVVYVSCLCNQKRERAA